MRFFCNAIALLLVVSARCCWQSNAQLAVAVNNDEGGDDGVEQTHEMASPLEFGEKTSNVTESSSTTDSIFVPDFDDSDGKERFIVTCIDDRIDECSTDIRAIDGLEIVHEFVGYDFFAIRALPSMVESISNLASVDFVEDDPVREMQEIVREDDHRHRRIQAATAYAFNQLKAKTFWDKYGRKGQGVKVCFVDSGIKYHKDLVRSRMSGTSVAGSPWNRDDEGHGTKVAGTVAGIRNKVGVAPLVSIHMAKIWNNDRKATATDIIIAAQACKNAGAKVINMSISGGKFVETEHRQYADLWNQGIFITAAAGNQGSGTVNAYPAAYHHIVSVGSTTVDKKRAFYSNYNNNVDFVAPGDDVRTLSSSNLNGYQNPPPSGTSYSTGYVAGIAALLMSKFPTKSNDEIYRALAETAEDLGPKFRDREFGYGFVDVIGAAKYLEESPVQVPTCRSDEYLFTIVAKTDSKGEEAAWQLYRNSVVVYEDMMHKDNAESQFQGCFPKNGCYYLKAYDVIGNGRDSTASYSLTVNDYELIKIQKVSKESVTSENFGSCNPIVFPPKCVDLVVTYRAKANPTRRSRGSKMTVSSKNPDEVLWTETAGVNLATGKTGKTGKKTGKKAGKKAGQTVTVNKKKRARTQNAKNNVRRRHLNGTNRNGYQGQSEPSTIVEKGTSTTSRVHAEESLVENTARSLQADPGTTMCVDPKGCYAISVVDYSYSLSALTVKYGGKTLHNGVDVNTYPPNTMQVGDGC